MPHPPPVRLPPPGASGLKDAGQLPHRVPYPPPGTSGLKAIPLQAPLRYDAEGSVRIAGCSISTTW